MYIIHLCHLSWMPFPASWFPQECPVLFSSKVGEFNTFSKPATFFFFFFVEVVFFPLVETQTENLLNYVYISTFHCVESALS